MNRPTLICQDERRRQKAREADFNGLDYLEVSDDQHRLTVYFLGKAPEGIGRENVRITGGRRVTDIHVVDVHLCLRDDPEQDDCMIITVDKPGDFSTYRLCLVGLGDEVRIDPRYTCLEFSFKVGCPSDLDCKPRDVCPPEERDEPEIDYLAKDYASLRRLILDRLALIMPDWQERHVPDVGIALVEILAYVGDHLSYYQDAVATEAYLDTARQRISVRRHARLVDYLMHEGCNARAWVSVWTSMDWKLRPGEIYFITGKGLPLEGTVLAADALRNIPRSRYEVFEPLSREPGEPIQLYEAHNEIHFYAWGDRECCLPRGATRATLLDEWVPVEAPEEGTQQQEQQPPHRLPRRPEGEGQEDYEYEEGEGKEKGKPPARPPALERSLHLKAGDFLIFEEIVGPETGNEADADPTHRHVVCLTRVERKRDPVVTREAEGYDRPLPTPVVEIEWAEEDALPFPLCISTIGPAWEDCQLLERISVARGNVILVDHGRTVEGEELGSVQAGISEQVCRGVGRPSDVTVVPEPFRPVLEQSPLTFSQPLPRARCSPASRLLMQDPHQALPQIGLTGNYAAPGGEEVHRWVPRRDLLASGGQERHFVVELDNGGRAHLRFGDDELGRMPEAGTAFSATYRVGNGRAGNVGTEAISHVVFRRDRPSGITLEPCNPLPARGGIAPQPLAQVKLFAPHVFRTRLERAITADDYAHLVMRDFEGRVQRAAATLRWNGSWYQVLVAVDPRGQVAADAALLDEIQNHLHRYRRVGHDVMVKPAQYVPLDIEITVCVLPDYLRGHVKAALIDVFSNRRLPGGRLGFFHPDKLTFGEGITLSGLVAAAQAVPGVESVTIGRLERLYEGANGEIESGLLPLGPLEVARLDNDPSFPENGQLQLDVRGGR